MIDESHLLAAYGRPDRSQPWLRANFVASLDGAATHEGRAGGLGDEEDQQVLRLVRQLADVVVVGAGTVRAEGYGGLGLDDAAVAWRRAHGLSDVPPLAIVSFSLEIDPDAEAFTAPGPRSLIITRSQAPSDRRAALSGVADVVLCGEDVVDPHLMLDALADRGLHHVLCEGGPRLFGSLVAADVVDELCLTVSPRLEGGNAVRISRGDAQTTRPMRLGHVLHGEKMLFLRYERDRSAEATAP